VARNLVTANWIAQISAPEASSCGSFTLLLRPNNNTQTLKSSTPADHDGGMARPHDPNLSRPISSNTSLLIYQIVFPLDRLRSAPSAIQSEATTSPIIWLETEFSRSVVWSPCASRRLLFLVIAGAAPSSPFAQWGDELVSLLPTNHRSAIYNHTPRYDRHNLPSHVELFKLLCLLF
jgi:hypothetical protein